MPPLDQFIPGVVGTVLCGAAAVWASAQLWLAFSAKRWEQTVGVVTHSSVVERRTRNGVSGRLRVTYQWASEGRTYEGSRVFFGDGLEGNLEVCRASSARYPVGAQVAVFNAGARSCLEPRCDWRVWVAAPFAWAMAAVIARALFN